MSRFFLGAGGGIAGVTSIAGLIGVVDADEIATEIAATAALKAAFAAPVSTACDVPSALGFTDLALAPTVTRQLAAWLIGAAGIIGRLAFSGSSTALTAPAHTYYVATTGSDVNNGTASGTPFRSIAAAIAAANTAGGSALIYVAAGDYLMTNGFNAVSPTVDVAYVAVGGTVRTGSLYDFATAFAVSTTYTESDASANPREIRTAYFVNTSGWSGGVTRVLDTTRVRPDGLFEELVRVATPGLCSITPGSFYQGALPTGGSAVLIRRRDATQPTAANTIVVRGVRNFYVSSQVNVYVGSLDGSAWEMWGCDGSHAFMDTAAIMLWNQTPTTARKVAIFENVRADYSGRENVAANAVSVQKWNGLVAFYNCSANAAAKDGFNFHNSTSDGSPAAKVQVLTVNCESLDSGRGTNTSCNGWTSHEDVVGVDIAGDYRLGRGGTIRNVGSSKTLLVGTRVARDLGDAMGGGASAPAAIRVDGTAQIWCDSVTVDAAKGTYAYAATETGKIHRRNCAPVPQPDFGVGTFDTY